MKLIRCQLSGFKSFARNTTLEFAHTITAIVGPNGSGKSNIAEAIRWVLGEQSIKSLRGKRGEDLIFNGSPETPRMGKAAAALVFDNRDGTIPIDFFEVTIERKIFRDGVNEYSLNHSLVRLKDIVELLARMGLGETKHNIISQGEVDQTLLAGPRERREMLEEAIGLRVYQIKKAEAERKLEETSRNITQARAITKEIAPHLRFLKLQAEKAENRGAIEQELRELEYAWILRAQSALQEETARHTTEHASETRRLKELDVEIASLEKEIAGWESRLRQPQTTNQFEQAITEHEKEHRALERELGRIEGRLEDQQKPALKENGPRMIDASLVRNRLAAILDRLEEVHAIDDFDEVRERIAMLINSIEHHLAEIESAADGPQNSKASVAGETALLLSGRSQIQTQMTALQVEIDALKAELRMATAEFNDSQMKIRMGERTLREKAEERSGLTSLLQRWLFEKERMEEKQGEIREEKDRLGVSFNELQSFDIRPFQNILPEELRRKIEKYRIRLEEIGGIDPSVMNEYHETHARHEFLEKEISDLEAASRDLRHLIAELEKTMERDFDAGFKKIKEEFNNYFRIIFGGGKGILKYAPLRSRGESEEERIEDGEREYGIEIDVDVPRKRVQSLTMLSGGERALASIALLFAITVVSPPPFLVLDETDAALDEANSKKYAAILKELSKKTQLILVTHNRETMKQAGILYGVTIGNDGVSKLLSLKLEEAEAYTNR